MKFKNNIQKNKCIVMIVLIVLAVILFCFSILDLVMFLLVMLICLYLFINAFYYYVKTGLSVQQDRITICYTRQSSTLFFPRLNYFVIDKKDLIRITKQVDRNKAMLCLVVEETNGTHFIQNMLSEIQIQDFITLCEEKNLIQNKK